MSNMIKAFDKAASISLPRAVALLWLVAGSVFVAACRQDMHDQPRYEPLEASSFFDDGKASRHLPEGVVPFGEYGYSDDSLLYTGRLAAGNTAQPAVSGSALGPSQVTDADINTRATQVAQDAQAGGAPAADQSGVAQPQGAQAGGAQTGAGFANVFPFPITAEVMDRGQERYNIYCSVCHGRTGNGDGVIVRRGYARPPALYEDRLIKAPAGYFFDVITNGFGSMPDYSAQVPPRDRWAIVAYIRALQLSQRATLADVPPEERSRLQSGANAQPQPNTPQNGRQHQ